MLSLCPSLGGAVKSIVGLLHADLHQSGVVASVCHLASTVISLTPRTNGQWVLARTTKRTKSGKVLQEVRIFCPFFVLVVFQLSVSEVQRSIISSFDLNCLSYIPSNVLLNCTWYITCKQFLFYHGIYFSLKRLMGMSSDCFGIFFTEICLIMWVILFLLL